MIDDRAGVGQTQRSFFHELVQRFFAGKSERSAVPTVEHFGTLIGGEQRQFCDGLCGVGNDGFEQCAKMAEPALDGRAVEKIGVVVAAEKEAVGCLGDV